MTDAAAKHRSVRQGPRLRRRGFDGKAEEGAACFLLASLSQQKQGPPRRLGPQRQPPAFGQAETGGIAAYFQNDDGKGSTAKRRLRDPERILQLAGRRLQKSLRLQPEIADADGIGQANLHRRDRIADPQNRRLGRDRVQSLRMQPRGKRQGKTARHTGIAEAERTDFRQRIERQTPLQRRIELVDTDRKERLFTRRLDRQGFRNTRHLPRRLVCQRFMRRSRQCRNRPAFQSGNGFTQGEKRFPRHGSLGHDVHSRSIMFLLCSYGFQSSEKESTPFHEKIFLCRNLHS